MLTNYIGDLKTGMEKEISETDLEAIKNKVREKIREHGTGVLAPVLKKAHNQLGQIRDKRINISVEYALDMLRKIEEWEVENGKN